jgi:hypothetical protein
MLSVIHSHSAWICASTCDSGFVPDSALSSCLSAYIPLGKDTAE